MTARVDSLERARTRPGFFDKMMEAMLRAELGVIVERAAECARSCWRAQLIVRLRQPQPRLPL